MNKLLASLSMTQRITIAVTALLAAGGIYALVHMQQEADFQPLFTGLAAEDAAGIVQKLKEAGVEYRIPNEGGAVLVPSARRAELRLSLAAAGLPKSGRIGFELFDKTNLGATEFTEQVNYRRALEGELERSVMSLSEVDQARVHLTFPKDSVFLDAQKPAKASVMVRLKPASRLSPQNVQAINHLVAAAVEGLSPDGVSVLDMNGNLLGRPHTPGSIDGPEPSEAGLDYRRKIEADLVAKVNATLEPLLGAEKFHAGVSVDCDFTGGEQSEEVFDPARSVMLSSQRTEDSSGTGTGNGVPGTASTLPRPASRPASGANRAARVTENVTYQSSRTVKKMRLPAGTIRKISVAVLVDQELKWEKDKSGPRRVLTPPSAEKLKVIHDLVAGVTGFNAERGDQLVVDTEPFENTLTLEPPLPPGAAVPGRPGQPAPAKLLQLDQKTLFIGGGVLVAVLVILVVFLRRGNGAFRGDASAPAELPAGRDTAVSVLDPEVRSRLAQHEAQQAEAEAQAALKLVPAITKTAEVMAKHLREKVAQAPEVSVQVLRGWIRDEETDR